MPKSKSPSSRRAWIEMSRIPPIICCVRVALLAEGVDRNIDTRQLPTSLRRRPPRGGRKMPPAGVSTLAISFSCTTADRYPLWQ